MVSLKNEREGEAYNDGRKRAKVSTELSLGRPLQQFRALADNLPHNFLTPF